MPPAVASSPSIAWRLPHVYSSSPCPCATLLLPPPLPRFTYKDNTLTNAPEPQPDGVPPQQPPPEVSRLTIERIVVLGLPPRATYTASVNGQSFPAAWGAPSLGSTSQQALVVRPQGLQVGSDWSLTISNAKAR